MFGTSTAKPAAPGFGLSGRTSGVATTGFSNASSSAPTGGGFGFGATATATAQPTAGGFGAQTSTGFGTSFGGPAGSSGFGAAAGTTPMNTGASSLQQPQGTPITGLATYARQSALARYLMEIDHAYNALHPKCRFRTFVYNMCVPGQSEEAVKRDRYVAAMNGGGCTEEEWLRALQRNPDPYRMYPSPLHFAQELQQRTAKQLEITEIMTDRVETLFKEVEAVLALDAANAVELLELRRGAVMLRRRWCAVLQKTEVLKRRGSGSAEDSVLLQRASTLHQILSSPGQFRQALMELQPYLDRTAATVGTSISSGSDGVGVRSTPLAQDRALLHSQVDPQVMRGWLSVTSRIQDGIEALDTLLRVDLQEMRAAQDRIKAE